MANMEAKNLTDLRVLATEFKEIKEKVNNNTQNCF